ncbi:unnamed protein product, partial [Symbiodinium necroappetens]
RRHAERSAHADPGPPAPLRRRLARVRPARQRRRGDRPGQDLPGRRQGRAEARAAGRQLGDPARQPVRPAGPQRRRQVDADQHPGRPGDQDRGHGADLGLRHRPADAPRARRHRRGAAGAQHRPLLHAARAAGAAGRALRRAAARTAHHGDPRHPGAGGQGAGLHPHPVGRHAPAPDGRQGDGAQPAGAGARRADRRRRHRAAPAALEPGARPQRAGHHHPADHPLPGGGGGALRHHRHHQPWPGDRLRADAPPAAPPRQQGAAGAPRHADRGGAGGAGALPAGAGRRRPPGLPLPHQPEPRGRHPRRPGAGPPAGAGHPHRGGGPGGHLSAAHPRRPQPDRRDQPGRRRPEWCPEWSPGRRPARARPDRAASGAGRRADRALRHCRRPGAAAAKLATQPPCADGGAAGAARLQRLRRRLAHAGAGLGGAGHR